MGDILPRLKIAINQRDQDQGLEIIIEDDCEGNGEMVAKDVSSGQGLTLHGTQMAVIGGELSFEQVPGKVTRVVLRLPIEKFDFYVDD